jgi:hypothetical protein
MNIRRSRTLTVYIKYAWRKGYKASLMYEQRTLVGRYLQQQNGIGNGRLSLRASACSALWPTAVFATYSISNKLGEILVNEINWRE